MGSGLGFATLLSLLVIIASVGLSSCIVHQHNDRLFYVPSKKMDLVDSNRFCHMISGHLVTNVTRDDFTPLAAVYAELPRDEYMRYDMWLAGSRRFDRDRTFFSRNYRWVLENRNGELVDPSLWLPGGPACSNECGVVFTQDRESKKFGLDSRNSFDRLFAVCEWDTRNEDQMVSLLQNLDAIDAGDRSVIEFVAKRRGS